MRPSLIIKALGDTLRSALQAGLPQGGLPQAPRAAASAFHDPDVAAAMARIQGCLGSEGDEDALLDVLRALQSQNAFLLRSADEEARGLLGSWAQLQRSLQLPDADVGQAAGSDPLRSAVRASGAIMASLELCHSHTYPDRGLMESEEVTAAVKDDFEQVERTLMLAVQEARSRGLGGQGVSRPLVSRAQGLAWALYESDKGPRLRADANEWLYDRFLKLLPSGILSGRKGIPLGLGFVFQAAAVRAGIPATLLSAGSLSQHYHRLGGCPVALTLPGGRHLEAERVGLLGRRLYAAMVQGDLAGTALPSWVTAKQASSAAYSALRADSVLASLADPESGETVLVDPAKRGQPVEPTHVLAALFGRTVADRMLPVLDSEGLSPADFALGADHEIVQWWGYTARTVMQGFQRRGESEDVAKWLHVVLGLEPTAAEWNQLPKGSL